MRQNALYHRVLSAVLLVTLIAMPLMAMGAGPEDPHKGDQGGKVAKLIEEALRKGEDPSKYVNVPKPTPTDPPISPYPKPNAVLYNPYATTVNPTYAYEPSSYVYSQFRAHAQKWYNKTSSLQVGYGNFESYFSYALSAERGNYFKYGHNNKMSMDQYLQMIISSNKMPAAR